MLPERKATTNRRGRSRRPGAEPGVVAQCPPYVYVKQTIGETPGAIKRQNGPRRADGRGLRGVGFKTDCWLLVAGLAAARWSKVVAGGWLLEPRCSRLVAGGLPLTRGGLRNELTSAQRPVSSVQPPSGQ